MGKIDVIKMKFVFLDGSSLELNDKTFREAITKVMNEHLQKEPLKVVFPTTKKVLYFDMNVFYAYLKEEIDQMELIEKTQCEGLFRNNTEMITNSNDNIDAGALWKKQGHYVYMVNDDEPVRCNYDEKLFFEI